MFRPEEARYQIGSSRIFRSLGFGRVSSHLAQQRPCLQVKYYSHLELWLIRAIIVLEAEGWSFWLKLQLHGLPPDIIVGDQVDQGGAQFRPN